MNRKFISKSNRVLRKVLNSNECLDIIQDFIESILDVKICKIKLNPYLNDNSNYLPEEENFDIADVRVVLDNNEEINVGIQFIDGYYVQSKMLLYYAQIHTNQLKLKQSISKTITINLVDFCCFNSEDYYKKIEIQDNCPKINEQIELHIVELPKTKSIYNIINKKEAWVIYFSGRDQISINKILNDFDKIKKLDDLLNEYWKNEKIE